MEDQKRIIDKDILGNFALIIGIYAVSSFLLFDLSDIRQRSVCFYLLLGTHILYTVLNNSSSSVFIKTTDYSLPYALSGFLLGIWFCLTDWLLPLEHISKFSGIILIFSSLAAFVAIVDIGEYFQKKINSEFIPPFFVVNIILFKIVMLTFALPFLVNGTWDWTIISFGDLIDIYTSREFMDPPRRLH